MARRSIDAGLPRGPSTLSVHGGEPPVQPGRSIVAPLVLSSTFPFADTAELVDFMEGRIDRPHEYGRYGNPTVDAVQRKLAALEKAEDALCFSSGMGAITTTLLSMLRAGQHVVFTADVYRKTRVFASQVLARFGVESSVVPPDAAAIADAIRPTTRVVFTETPTNPYLRVVDLEAVVDVAKRARVKVVVDATFATPINLRPLEWGVDLVIHSATKYLGGHNDLMAGVTCGSAALVGAVREQLGTLGGIVDPTTAFLLARGLKTLALRVERHSASALHLAELLAAHPAIARVWYPLHPSHPDHAVASRLLRGGGGVVSFEVHGGDAAATQLIEATTIPHLAPSLGGVESLIEQPALMSFFELDPEQRAAVGIVPGLVRMSVGIEDVEDLEADLLGGLSQLSV
jgi:cystathionine gamma-synthase